MRSSRRASSWISPVATISLYIATSIDLLRYPPSCRGWLRSVFVTSRPRRISYSTVRARAFLYSVRRWVERESACRSVFIRVSLLLDQFQSYSSDQTHLCAGTSPYVIRSPFFLAR